MGKQLKKSSLKSAKVTSRAQQTYFFSRDTIAPYNAETINELISKHPSQPSNKLPEPPQLPAATPIVTAEDVSKAIISFKSGSASGPDGLSPQHLKDMINGLLGENSKVLLESLAALFNLILSGRVPNDITPVLYGANLCALKKKDGGIRPIAVGSTLRRIASKICCKKVLPQLSSRFQPIQLGFGSKGGCEAAVHATRTYLENNSGEVLIKVDVRNAFNSVDRGALLREIKEFLPALFPFLWQCYAAPSNLIYKDTCIDSTVGCQQGDPLGPAIFSLAIHPIIAKLKSRLNIWYLDDGTLGGDANTVMADLVALRAEFAQIGLDLNFAKCELFINNTLPEDTQQSIAQDFKTCAPGIKFLTKETATLLGAPLTDEAFPHFVQKQIDTYKESADRLMEINSTWHYT
ncbi:reverse transcriptase (RNA-dependent DNA polymerase) domain-containing protein [Phthorimaea operculella]|nr:reverse transcriptase (RNA-dependent DNA polymerase) domain-containing protein [Phthorimaea operculella]